MDKELFGYISLAFTFAAYTPYMWLTWKGRIKPHVFSWAIWALLMGIGAAGQMAGHAGPGAWSSAFSALSCFIICLLSLHYGEKNITKHDVTIFIAGLSAIPLWYFTSEPLAAILLVTFIDGLGYIPTIRKSWHRPHEEMPVHYIISNTKHFAAFFAMTAYNYTTMFYPVALFIMNGLLVIMIYYRRYTLKPKRA
jgi:chromate transport protein ChrA